MSEFEIWLREILDDKGYSLSEFCREIGISRRSLYNYFIGRSKFSSGTKRKMCELLQVDVDFETKNRGKRGPNKEKKNDTEVHLSV